MPDVPGRRTILIVDVDRERLDCLGEYARAAGLLVSTAACFATARQAIRNGPTDVLVSALPLGAYNGLHLALVAGQDHPDCAVVIFSEEGCSDRSSEIETVNIRMLRADHLLEPQFWRELATARDTPPGIASDPLRAIA